MNTFDCVEHALKGTKFLKQVIPLPSPPICIEDKYQSQNHIIPLMGFVHTTENIPLKSILKLMFIIVIIMMTMPLQQQAYEYLTLSII